MALDWRPGAEIALLRQRAQLLRQVRAFFDKRGVWEVETPSLSQAATTDPMIESLGVMGSSQEQGGEILQYLQTSPEFFMKRLLAADSGSIYQLSKAYRAGESGRLHNPEFTLLEWYRLDMDHLQLMEEVEQLLCEVLSPFHALEASERLTYQGLFQQYCGFDPHAATAGDLRDYCSRAGMNLQFLTNMTRDDWLNLILSHQIEPELGQGRLTLIYDYPASQASLAKVRPGPPIVAERFEVYFKGIELANGFHELLDENEQRDRFEKDRLTRQTKGQVMVPQDERFLRALEAGMPPCAGVAVGFDRLVMLALGADSLDQIMAFSVDRV